MGNFIKNIEVPWKPYTPPADGKPKASGGSAVAIELSLAIRISDSCMS